MGSNNYIMAGLPFGAIDVVLFLCWHKRKRCTFCVHSLGSQCSYLYDKTLKNVSTYTEESVFTRVMDIISNTDSTSGAGDDNCSSCLARMKHRKARWRYR
jgi:hypothetical protein